MNDRGFETSKIGNDFWPGFDVDLALESPLHRKYILSSGANASSLSLSNNVHNYGDMNQMFLHFNNEEISQITDLTNSLPNESSQKGIEESIFDPVVPSSQENGILSSKRPMEPIDVYGGVMCYEGKLVLQLRHFNLNTNFPMNVKECWLCRERMAAGSSLHSHKHVLQGIFQVNDEFVQMDIDHYIIPEQALEPPDSKELANMMSNNNLIAGSNSAAFDTSHPLSFDEELHDNVSTEPSHSALKSNPWQAQHFITDNSVRNPLLEYSSKNSNEIKFTHSSDKPTVGLAQNALCSLPLSQNNYFHPSTSKNEVLCNENSIFSNNYENLSNHLPSNKLTLQTSSSSSGNLSHSLLTSSRNSSIEPNTSSLKCSSNLQDANVTHSTLDTDTPTTCSLLSLNSLSNTKNILTTSSSLDLSESIPSTNNSEFFSNNSNCYTPAATNYISSNNKGFPINDSKGSAHPISESSSTPVSSHSSSNVLLKPTESFSNPFNSQKLINDNSLDKNSNPLLNSIHKNNSTSYQSFFDSAYSCNSTFINLSSITTSESSTSTSSTKLVSSTESTQKVEIGARKRKSKAQKKLSVIKMKDDTEEMPQPLEIAKPKDFSLRYPLDSWFDSSFPPGNSRSINTNTQKKISNIKCTMTKPRINNNNLHNSPDLKLVKESLLNEKIKCKICHQEFAKEWIAYRKHMQEHRVPDSELFVCVLCSKKFSCTKNYLQHIKTHGPNKHHCKMCSATFSRPDKLRRHVNTVHNKICKFKCTVCNKSFLRKEYLNKHYYIHNGTKFSCTQCNMSFSNKYNLEVHKRTHAKERPFKCELCDSEFVRRDFLDNHMEKDHKKKRYGCNICEKYFSRADALTRHKLTHTDQSYPCSICKKRYARKDLLKNHEETHRNPGKHKCIHCPAVFKRREVLKKHLVTHQTKAQCNICLKFLPNSLRLQNHMRWHENQSTDKSKASLFECNQCTKQFSTQDQRQKHIDKFHRSFDSCNKTKEPVERGEKKFFCTTCSKGFTRSCNLRAHIKTHNKSADDEEILSELPSVLIASKSLPKQKKKSTAQTPSLLQIGDPSCSSFDPAGSQQDSSCVSREILSANASFLKPLEDTLHNVPYPSHPSSFHLASSSPSDLPVPVRPPSSPINLSSEVITAAAYLLAYPSYSGPYQ